MFVDRAMAAVSHRLFFALVPDVVTARQMQVYAETLATGGRVQPAGRMHITLATTPLLSSFARSIAEALIDIGARVAAGLPALAVHLDQLTAGQGSLALRIRHAAPDMNALLEGLEREMRAAGLPVQSRTFRPHVTLSYDSHGPMDRPCRAFEWRAERLVLIHSLHGRTQHLPLGEWRFGGKPRQGDLFG